MTEFKKKYLKYKLKYEKLKQQAGANLNVKNIAKEQL